jgi:hypothetical protein
VHDLLVSTAQCHAANPRNARVPLQPQHEINKGEPAVFAHEICMAVGDTDLLDAIAACNEGDAPRRRGLAERVGVGAASRPALVSHPIEVPTCEDVDALLGHASSFRGPARRPEALVG